MRCSLCRKDLPEDAFSPKRTNQTAHFAADGDLRTYRSPCTRGRHYNCKACRRRRWKEKQAERLSANSVPLAAPTPSSSEG